jgi:O-methyltransferase domain
MPRWSKASPCIDTHYFVLKSRSAGSDFPWNDMPADTTFCDVGGGVGGVSMALFKAHPHLKVTLQDLPNVIEQAYEVSVAHCTSSRHLHDMFIQFWTKECPHAVQDKRVDFVAVDFMKEGPVKGHNIYYVRIYIGRLFIYLI